MCSINISSIQDIGHPGLSVEFFQSAPFVFISCLISPQSLWPICCQYCISLYSLAPLFFPQTFLANAQLWTNLTFFMPMSKLLEKKSTSEQMVATVTSVPVASAGPLTLPGNPHALPWSTVFPVLQRNNFKPSSLSSNLLSFPHQTLHSLWII